MTENNGNNNSRLDRIEKTLDRLLLGLGETKANIDNVNKGLQETRAIANSNSRAIEAMIEQRATDRLEHEERMRKHDQEIAELRAISSRLAEVQLGMAKMLGNIDETNPTILKRLMAIENKVDQMLEKNQE
ncbi:MAG: hypothetical protein QNJ70_20725 [Xenococcaceae cyanobacterium MO_207.B15]|nr:hypothetical protein [Xenococcaceae cyanobacterium MO_207.B15]